jgi:hypothetical protein
MKFQWPRKANWGFHIHALNAQRKGQKCAAKRLINQGKITPISPSSKENIL